MGVEKLLDSAGGLWNKSDKSSQRMQKRLLQAVSGIIQSLHMIPNTYPARVMPPNRWIMCVTYVSDRGVDGVEAISRLPTGKRYLNKIINNPNVINMRKNEKCEVSQSLFRP